MRLEDQGAGEAGWSIKQDGYLSRNAQKGSGPCEYRVLAEGTQRESLQETSRWRSEVLCDLQAI